MVGTSAKKTQRRNKGRRLEQGRQFLAAAVRDVVSLLRDLIQVETSRPWHHQKVTWQFYHRGDFWIFSLRSNLHDRFRHLRASEELNGQFLAATPEEADFVAPWPLRESPRGFSLRVLTHVPTLRDQGVGALCDLCVPCASPLGW